MSGSFLTPSQLAERYEIAEATLADWRYKGNGPLYLKVGRLVRYPLAEVEAWERLRSSAARKMENASSDAIALPRTSGSQWGTQVRPEAG